VALAVFGVLIVTGAWGRHPEPPNATMAVRWTALAPLTTEAMVRTPSPAQARAATYLLGVPVLAALLAVVADLTGHAGACGGLPATSGSPRGPSY
jgi:hypothetical protein